LYIFLLPFEQERESRGTRGKGRKRLNDGYSDPFEPIGLETDLTYPHP
jgi:hypothetical protein